jgi:outer membrane protein TolC
MSFPSAARRAVPAVAAMLLFAAAAGADETPHPHAYDAPPAGSPLSLAEAMRLATTDQPLLGARQASIDAAEHAAVAAAQLPDPKLSAGVQDLPVDRGEAFSVRDDNFTTFTLGLSQELPRAGKRQLRGERKQLEADVDRLGLESDRRGIGRDAALDWLDVYQAEQTLLLTRQLAGESALQLQSLESAYRAGRAPQADWLAAKVEAALVGDRLQDGQHHVERMRAELSRWIGEAAQRPLPDDPSGDLAGLPQPDQFPQLLAQVDHHPLLSGLQKQVDVARNDVAQARQAYRPDFAVEGYFGYRPAYADFVGLRVSMDLPWFTAQRQDRSLAAALRQTDAAQDREEDALRQLHAQATADYIDWHHARQRVAAFDADIIPAARRRAEAAQAAYAAGGSSLDAVLLARRSLLDLQLQRLALAVDAARAQVRLQYFASGN